MIVKGELYHVCNMIGEQRLLNFQSHDRGKITMKKYANVALIVLSAVILLGVALTVGVLTMDKSVIKVELDDGEAQQIRFKDLSLLPGQSSEYTLSFSDEYSRRYEAKLCFSPVDTGNHLADYVYVCIKQGDETLYDQLLADFFEQGEFSIAIDFTEGKDTDVKLFYYLPETVGNEAQNATADFTLDVTADN